MGPWAGSLAALIGGVIGLFLTPAAYPMGFLDAVQVVMYPALFAGLAVNGDKYWKFFTPIYVIQVILFNTVPFYFPGKLADFPAPPQPTYFLSTLYYWLPWLIIYLSPIGIKYIPKWARGANRAKRWGAIFLSSLICYMAWYTSSCFWIYWLFYTYPLELVLTMNFFVYTWYIPAFTIAATIVTVAIIEALRKSGFPSPPEAIW